MHNKCQFAAKVTAVISLSNALLQPSRNPSAFIFYYKNTDKRKKS